jgi:SAM-dependent methyltransferase
MLRNLLIHPAIYSCFVNAIGARRVRRLLVQRYLCPKKGDRILDIGCGPADILEELPDVTYVGLDSNPRYIAAAKARFGSRGKFHVEMIDAQTTKAYRGFDLVIATGILHHLDDSSAQRLIAVAHAALKTGGRLVTLDGCFTRNQSPITRWLLKKDRGRFVRSAETYLRLAKTVFTQVKEDISTDLLRIPYTHLVMTCTRE